MKRIFEIIHSGNSSNPFQCNTEEDKFMFELPQTNARTLEEYSSAQSAGTPKKFYQAQPKKVKKKYPKKIGKKIAWTKEEHDLLVKGAAMFGKNWKKLDNFIKTKSKKQIESHAQKHPEIKFGSDNSLSLNNVLKAFATSSNLPKCRPSNLKNNQEQDLKLKFDSRSELDQKSIPDSMSNPELESKPEPESELEIESDRRSIDSFFNEFSNLPLSSIDNSIILLESPYNYEYSSLIERTINEPNSNLIFSG